MEDVSREDGGRQKRTWWRNGRDVRGAYRAGGNKAQRRRMGEVVWRMKRVSGGRAVGGPLEFWFSLIREERE